METLAKGIPVVVVDNKSGLADNPIPENISSDIWQMCYTSEDVKQAIEYYNSRSKNQREEHEMVGAEIRKEYFEPVTTEGVRALLNLS